jgi:threonine synthase
VALRASGWISTADEVVVLNTGSGLVYPGTVGNDAPVLQPTDEIPV